MNCNTNLLIFRHLALITHDATMSVNSSVLNEMILWGLVKTFSQAIPSMSDSIVVVIVVAQPHV